MKRLSVSILMTVAALGFAGKKYNVKIVDRQDNEIQYSYTVPSSLASRSTTDVNCSSNANCSASTRTTTSGAPARAVSYEVRGATLTLLLPDGRRAVVNCDMKTNWTGQPTGWYRSCRIPLTDSVEAEFDSNKATLKWSVSLDGKKIQSETYKIVAVVEPPTK